MKRFIQVFLVASILFACKKSEEVNPSNNVDVYIAGKGSNGAMYWKNGIPTTLTLTGLAYGGVATSIAVSGNDIYVAGYDARHGNSNNVAVYWKNGTQTVLPGGTQALSILISDNNIYIVGYDTNNVAIYWKNGIPKLLTEGTVATSIATSGNDIYIAGYNRIPGDVYVPMYWKNEKPVTLNGSSGATSIAVSGNDVYVTGSDPGFSSFGIQYSSFKGDAAKYWKNGKEIFLSDTSVITIGSGQPVPSVNNSITTSIAISDNDVYITGYEGSHSNEATYWKNGMPTTLVGENGGGAATSIAFSGKDIYIAGCNGIDGNYSTNSATYWKNGTPTKLTDGIYAYSIFIVPK